MSGFKRQLNKHVAFLRGINRFLIHVTKEYIQPVRKKCYGELGENTYIETPVFFTNQKNVFIEDNTKIRRGFILINNIGKFILKKYSVISTNCTVVTGNHSKNVTVPHIISGAYHINDEESDIVIGEDVWIGVNCTLLSGAKIGRGAVIGGCSMVNKDIPPYAVAVGTPAKIIATSFSIDEIIRHEESLYPINERFSREELEQIFNQYYSGKKSIGKILSTEDSLSVRNIKSSLGITTYEYNLNKCL